MASFTPIAQVTPGASTGNESFVLSTTSGTYALSMHGAAKLITDIYPSGSFLLNGREVGLNTGNTITAESGAYIFTGTTADTETRTDAANVLLDRNYAIVANNATYTLSMQSADLMKGFGIGAETGTYTVTYNDINASVRFAAPSGSFLMFGQPAFKGVGESFEAGSFTVTTQDATLSYGRNIYPVTHGYSLTGHDVTFRGFFNPFVTEETYTEEDVAVVETWTEQDVPVSTTWTQVA